MNEQSQTQTLPEQEIYNELLAGAKTHEEIVALREMAQGDLAKTATASSDGETFKVTELGKDKFAELNKSAEEIEEAMSVDPESWRNEEK